MQTLSGQSSINNLKNQPRAIAVISIIFFALAGLLSGFAVGAFTHPAPQQLANNTNTTLTPPTQSKINTATTSKHSSKTIYLGYPVVEQVTQIEAADGNTPYTFSAQIVDQSISKTQGKPVQASDVTCKMWLTKHGNTVKAINGKNEARLRSIDTIQQPFPEEVTNALTFTNSSQTQFCNDKGPTMWNYTISSSVESGTYFIVVLADWKGVHYNWYSISITIQRGGD